MRKMITLLAISIVALLLANCEKEENRNQNEAIAGTWQLTQIRGGIHGQGYTPFFSHLKLTSTRYQLLSQDNLLLEGTYSVSDDTIRFQSNTTNDTYKMFVEHPKMIHLPDEQTLHLSEPCCDLFSYTFSKAGE